MAEPCPYSCKPAEDDRGACSLLQAAYVLAGLAMMLNIRLSYSSAPYALIRFRLPENLFSVFVRRMASALELWCLPGFIIVDIIEYAIKLTIKGIGNYGDNTLKSKKLKFQSIICLSIIAQWLNFITYVILFFVYLAGDDQGHLTTFYFVIAISGFVFGISNPLVYAVDYNYVPIYIVGENCFPALTSFIHYITTLIFGNRRKWDSDFLIVFIDIFVAIIISLVAAMVWTYAYGYSTDSGPFDGTITYTTTKDITKIIVTGITTNNKVTKTVTITPGTVTIKAYTKTDTVENGKTCNYNTRVATPIATATQAKITAADGKATLTIDIINITPDTNADVLNALQKLVIPHSCNVYVANDNTLTIKYAPNLGGKCTVIEIKITDTKSDFKNLGLQPTNDATISVDPPPNHLKIEYKTANGFPVTKGYINKASVTKNIGEAIKKAADHATPPNAETYYNIPDRTTNIRYSFKLTEDQADQLKTGGTITDTTTKIIVQYGHIFAEGFGGTDANPAMIAPLLIVLVGMGLVYTIYPGIAPGMIVPFYLIDKIEMVLLIATIFPPVIVAILRKTSGFKDPKSPLCEWGPTNKQPWPGGTDQGQGIHWHLFDLIVPIMIILAYIFIYSLHYRDSNISRSIINQPKMSTALTIIFYMCHEISLAVGFAGMIGNAPEWTVLAQMIGAFLMVFLALYSEGYIIEYKSHDPADWLINGMWHVFGIVC